MASRCRIGHSGPEDLAIARRWGRGRQRQAPQGCPPTPAPFDAWLNGNDAALTEQNRSGLELFIDAGCASRNGGINLGGDGYLPFGLIEKPVVGPWRFGAAFLYRFAACLGRL